MQDRQDADFKWPIKYVFDYELESFQEDFYSHEFVDYHEYLFDQLQQLLSAETIRESDLRYARFTVECLRFGVIGVLKKTLFAHQIEQQVWRSTNGTE